MEQFDPKSFPLPVDEEYRLEVLRSLNILDTEKEVEYDRITSLASRIFQTKMSFVSLVDKDRQWFKSACGLDSNETSRGVSFCAYGIAERRPFIVLDATKDVRFSENDLVTGHPHIRFYAGVPIIVDNTAIGSFCIIDDKPRDHFGEEDLDSLKDLAAIVQDQIQLLSATKASTDGARHALKQSQSLAQAGTMAKEQFLSLMSHELRTPLNAIIGFADVIHSEILGPIDNDSYRTYAQEISKSGHRQLHLIDRVLKLVSAGSLELENDTFDLTELVRDCAEMLQGEALLKEISVDPDLPSYALNITTDKALTEQIILELIANAIQFSPSKSQVAVSLAKDSLGQIVFTTRNIGSVTAELTPDSKDQEIGYTHDVYTLDNDGMGLGFPLIQRLCAVTGAKLFIKNRPQNMVQTQVYFSKQN
jgi:nitrogen-specific signal transduction histidine kinase